MSGERALAGQTALVTGASAGIGRAVALALASHGAAVWLVARRAEELERVASAARSAGGRARAFAADVTRDGDLRRLHDRLRDEDVPVDMLIHCAAAHHRGPVADAPVDQLDELYRTNVRAPYVLTQLLLPMLRARRGQVVFVNSSVGLQARAQVAAYAATKHALRALADALREEVNGDGVRVVSVYPGRTATPGQEAIHAAEGRTYQPERLLQPADVAAVIVQALRLARTAEVTDIRVRPMQQ